MTRALIAAAVALAVPAAAAGDPLARLQALWYGADRAAFTETVLEDGEPVAKIKYRVDPPRVRLEVYDYAQSRTRPVHLLVGRGEGLYHIGPSGAVPVDRTEEGWDDPHLQIALLPWMDSVEADLGEGVLEGRWGPLRKRVWLDGTGRPVRFQVEGPELRMEAVVQYIGERIRRLRVTAGEREFVVRRGVLRRGVPFAAALFSLPAPTETPEFPREPAPVPVPEADPLAEVEQARVSLEEVASFLAEGGLRPLGR